MPTLTIASGAALRIVCPDSDNALADGTVLSPEQRHRGDGAAPFEGNPVAGPIAVEGATDGDCLAIRIETIELDRSWGQTLLSPGHGLLPGHLLIPDQAEQPEKAIPRHMYRWEIDGSAGVAHVANPLGAAPVAVKLDPFIGCIGVCPKWSQAISTMYAGPHGGNMDLPAVRPGATFYLPVYHAGGLLMLGDIHAAQGAGEIIGGAIETSGKVDCSITLIRKRRLPAPRLIDGTRIMAMGCDGELRAAVQQAYAHLLDWIADDLGFNRWDAYNLISQTGTVAIGGLLAPPYVVGAAVPLAALPETVLRRIESWRA